MTSKIASEIYNEMVKKKLYEGSTEVMGHNTYIVKAMCMTHENEEPVPQEYSVQAGSPEQAKAAAMAMSKEMNHTSCKITDVTMVPNSDEKLHNMGSEDSLNADPSATDGQVMPSDVSKDLDNMDA